MLNKNKSGKNIKTGKPSKKAPTILFTKNTSIIKNNFSSIQNNNNSKHSYFSKCHHPTFFSSAKNYSNNKRNINKDQIIKQCKSLQSQFKFEDPDQIYGIASSPNLKPSFKYLLKPIDHLINHNVEFVPFAINPYSAKTNNRRYYDHNALESADIMMHWAAECAEHGLYEKVEPLIQRSMGIYEAQRGPFDREIVVMKTCLGITFNRIGKFWDAIGELRNASEINFPEVAITLYSHQSRDENLQLLINVETSHSQLYLGKLSESEKLSQQVIKQSSEKGQYQYSAHARFVLGYTYCKLAQQKNCIKALEELILCGEDSAPHIDYFGAFNETAHNKIFLGICRGTFGDFVGAIKDMQEGVRVLNYTSTSCGRINSFAAKVEMLIHLINEYVASQKNTANAEHTLQPRLDNFSRRLKLDDLTQVGYCGERQGRTDIVVPSEGINCNFHYSEITYKEVINPELWKTLLSQELPITTNFFTALGSNKLNNTDLQLTLELYLRTLYEFCKKKVDGSSLLDHTQFDIVKLNEWIFYIGRDSDVPQRYPLAITPEFFSLVKTPEFYPKFRLDERKYASKLLMAIGFCYQRLHDAEKASNSYVGALQIFYPGIMDADVNEILDNAHYNEDDIIFLTKLLKNAAETKLLKKMAKSKFLDYFTVDKATKRIVQAIGIIEELAWRKTIKHGNLNLVEFQVCANAGERNEKLRKWNKNENPFFIAVERDLQKIYFSGPDQFGTMRSGYLQYDEKLEGIYNINDIYSYCKDFIYIEPKETLDANLISYKILRSLNHKPHFYFKENEENHFVFQTILRASKKHNERIMLLKMLLAQYEIFPHIAHNEEPQRTMTYAHRLLYLGIAYADIQEYDKALSIIEKSHRMYKEAYENKIGICSNGYEGTLEFINSIESLITDIAEHCGTLNNNQLTLKH